MYAVSSSNSVMRDTHVMVADGELYVHTADA